MENRTPKLHKISVVTIIVTIILSFYMFNSTGKYRKVPMESERFQSFKEQIVATYPEVEDLELLSREGKGPSGIDFEYTISSDASDDVIEGIFNQTKALIAEFEFQDFLVLPDEIDPSVTSLSYFKTMADMYITFTREGESEAFLGYTSAYDNGVEYDVADENILHTRYNIWYPANEGDMGWPK